MAREIFTANLFLVIFFFFIKKTHENFLNIQSRLMIAQYVTENDFPCSLYFLLA